MIKDKNKEPDLTFEEHNFGVVCSDANNLSVMYDGKTHKSKCSDYGIALQAVSTTKVTKAFPTLVDVSWNSRNGDKYEYQLDFNEIFKGKKVLYDDSTFADGRVILTYREFKDLFLILKDNPYRNLKIIVVVSNRTLIVFMDVEIKLKNDDRVDEPYGYYRVTTEMFKKTFKSKTLDLHFSSPEAAMTCYNASDLKLSYDEKVYDKQNYDEKAYTKQVYNKDGKCRKKTPYDEKRSINRNLSFGAFYAPIDISWNSNDGQSHKYRFDLREIFKDRKVLHKENEEDIWIESPYGNLKIIIEVDDRTLNIYMDVYIKLDLPNAKSHDKHKRNKTLAFTKIF